MPIHIDIYGVTQVTRLRSLEIRCAEDFVWEELPKGFLYGKKNAAQKIIGKYLQFRGGLLHTPLLRCVSCCYYYIICDPPTRKYFFHYRPLKKKETKISLCLPSSLQCSLGCLLPYVTQHPLVGILISSAACVCTKACSLKHPSTRIRALLLGVHTLCT